MYRLGILVLVSVVLLLPFLINDAQALQVIVKAVDEIVNNDETLQDDDDFFFACDANQTYYFKQILFADVGTSDFDHRWTLPSGASGEISQSTFTSANFVVLDDITSEELITGQGLGTVTIAHFEGRIVMSTTSGTCQFQWAQNFAQVQDTKVLKGSSLEVYQQGITQTAVNSLTHTKVTKSQDDVVNNSITLVNDSELFFVGEANKSYHLTLMLFLTSPSNADIKHVWTLPTGATGQRISEDFNWFFGGSASNSEDVETLINVSTNGGNQQQQIYAQIDIGSTGGTVNFQFAQQTAQVSNTILQKGSTLLVYEEGTALSNAVGQQGIQGIQGIQGVAGSAGSDGSKGDKGDAGGSPVGDPVGDPISEEDIIEAVLAEIDFVQPNIAEAVVQTFFEFSVVDASLNQLTLNSLVTNERLGIRWSSGQDMTITSATPALSPFTVTFETFPSVKRGSGAVISTDFILYNIGVPNRNCTIQIRSDCVEKVRYEIPVTVNGIVNGVQVSDTGTITIDLSEGTFDPILLLILSMFFIPAGGVAIQKLRGRSGNIPLRRITRS